MANHHFGKLADVWKHLALAEVLTKEGPAGYGETHAGSGAYPIVDDSERRFGVRGFLEIAETAEMLAGSRYRALLDDFGVMRDVYPGSALQAMSILGERAEYLLCDLDPESAADLRGWADRMRIAKCEVAEFDGMATIAAWLEEWNPANGWAIVHIDPFDAHLATPAGISALELAARVAEQGHGLVYWYGYSSPEESASGYRDLRDLTQHPLWCGDVMVVGASAAVLPGGDLGASTTPGTGCGVVLANVDETTRATCAKLGAALAAGYAGSTLPDGTRGGVAFTVHES